MLETTALKAKNELFLLKTLLWAPSHQGGEAGANFNLELRGRPEIKLNHSGVDPRIPAELVPRGSSSMEIVMGWVSPQIPDLSCDKELNS